MAHNALENGVSTPMFSYMYFTAETFVESLLMSTPVYVVCWNWNLFNIVVKIAYLELLLRRLDSTKMCWLNVFMSLIENNNNKNTELQYRHICCQPSEGNPVKCKNWTSVFDFEHINFTNRSATHRSRKKKQCISRWDESLQTVSARSTLFANWSVLFCRVERVKLVNEHLCFLISYWKFINGISQGNDMKKRYQTVPII